MVQFIDARFGRQALISLLPDTSNTQLLKNLNLSEDRFFTEWQEWMKERQAP
jgi:hypothetical protein